METMLTDLSEREILVRSKLIRKKRLVAKRNRKLAEIAQRCGQADIEWPKGRFAVLYLDPPWEHDTWAESGMDRSPTNHYPVMSIGEIAALPIKTMALDDAALFLWTTVPHLFAALILIQQWGFIYRSHLVWDKQLIGLGKWSRNQHEILLIGTRGGMPGPIEGEEQPASIVSIRRAAHSAKPEFFREMIDRLYPGVPKVELFHRGDAPDGWTVWGNEARAK